MRDIGLFIWVGHPDPGRRQQHRQERQRQQQAARRRHRGPAGARAPAPLTSPPGSERPAGDRHARDAGHRRATGRRRPGAAACPSRPASQAVPATAPARRPRGASGAGPACGRATARPRQAPPVRRPSSERRWSAPSSRRRCSASLEPSATNILDSLTQRSIDLHELSDRVRLFGEYDRNLSAIESSLDVAVHADGDRLLLAGDDAAVARAERVVQRVLDAAVGGAHITPDDVALALSDSASRVRKRRARRNAAAHASRPRNSSAYRRATRVRPRDRPNHADVRHRARPARERRTSRS